MYFAWWANMGGGLIDRKTQKLIPMFSNHADMMPPKFVVVLYPAVLRGFPHPDSAVQHVHAGT